ncbi:MULTISPECIES: addiction module protein [unclassified Bradyrhizobium]|uniref:addiction module protein n=1 Tax=unclassified Bradyrhizobium TaxID=2631580 RepID=UPI0028E8E279|nr:MULTISPECIES: addiction module protein [unclassified Bradyrhizobium]
MLTTKDRPDFIALLWDSLASEDARLTSAQEVWLARRLAGFDADARGAVPWRISTAIFSPELTLRLRGEGHLQIIETFC